MSRRAVVKLDAEGKDPATGQLPDLTKSGTLGVVWNTAKEIEEGGDRAAAFATRPTIGGEEDDQGHVTNAVLTTGGEIHLAKEAQGGRNGVFGDSLKARLNAVHEMGHIVGLDHEDKRDAAMNPKEEVQNQEGTITDDDVKELENVYTNTHVDIEQNADAHSIFRFTYTLTFLSGADLGLFQVGLGPGADFLDPTAPPGWVATRTGRVATFRVTVLGDQVRYLSAQNSPLTFSFASSAPPGFGPGWAGALATVVAPTTPAGQPVSRFIGKAHGIGRGPEKAGVELMGRFSLDRTIDLTAARVTVSNLLNEISGTSEVVEALPVTLVPLPGNRPTSGRFERRVSPNFSAATIRAIGNGEYNLSLKVGKATIPAPPGQCPASRLTMTLILEDGTNPPAVVTTEQPWRCLVRGNRIEYLTAP
jgi:hypothetical protein